MSDWIPCSERMPEFPRWTAETDELYSGLANELYADYWFCGCGASGLAVALLRDVLRAIEDRTHAPLYADGATGTFDAQGRWTHPPMTAEYKDAHDRLRALIGWEDSDDEAHFWNYLYILDHFDLTEHGTSCRVGWLTDKGRDLLRRLESVDLDALCHGEPTDEGAMPLPDPPTEAT
jgi:hypothetical protein